MIALLLTQPSSEGEQNWSLSQQQSCLSLLQQQSPVLSQISSHQQSHPEPPPSLPAQLPAELQSGGEVVTIVLRTADSPASVATSLLVVGDGAVVVSMVAMVDCWCSLSQSTCVSLYSVSLSQQQSPVSSHSSSHQQADLEPLQHWSWQLSAELHTTAKLVFSPPTF